MQPGVDRFELLGEGVHFRLRSRNCYIASKAPNDAQVMRHLLGEFVQDQWHENVDTCSRRECGSEIEAGWHYAGNGKVPAVKRKNLPDRTRIRAEAALPEAMAEHHNWRRPWLILAGAKRAPNNGLHP